MKNILCTLAAISVGLVASAAAANGATVINTVPYNITQSGDYELGANFNYNAANGAIIFISASNVTLDFKGFYIAGPVGNTSQTAIGIFASERSNLTIKNGTIAFCNIGVSINGDSSATTNNVGHRIESMRVTYCYAYGVRFTGDAPGSRIADCQVSKIGGVTVAGFPDQSGYAIRINGSGVTIRNNIISDVTATGSGVSFGIAAADGVFSIRNTIANASTGINGGKYQNNLTSNVATPFSGGVNAGGNN